MNERNPSLLETLWREDISLTNRPPRSGRHYQELCDQIEALEKSLCQEFTPEQQASYEKLVYCWDDRASEEMLGHFIQGFRFGGQCIYEVFCRTD